MVRMRVAGMPVRSGSWDGVNPENVVYVYSCEGGWMSLEMVTGARQWVRRLGEEGGALGTPTLKS